MESIINIVKTLFASVDQRNWKSITATMADKILLDYSSMTGAAAAWLSSGDIITAWASFLPGFDKTHHQISGFKTKVLKNTATVHCLGKADHFAGEEIWTVEGSYDIVLKNTEKGWLIKEFKFNFVRESGNTGLPDVARGRSIGDPGFSASE